MDNLRDRVNDACRLFLSAKENKELIENDEYMLSLLGCMAELYKNQIHGYLEECYGEDAEKEVRLHIRFIITHVIGLLEAKKTNLAKLYSKAKKQGGEEVEKIKETYMKYMEVREDFWALASFRSMEHFAQYMEWDLDPSVRIMSQNIEQGNLKSYFYYANQAVLDFSWTNIFLEMPTGYGKDYTDTVTLAFMFGVNKDEDCLKVTGNPSNLAENSTKIVKYMLKPRYAKVFPYYEKFQCEKDSMFSVLQMGGIQAPTRFLISGSTMGCSLFFTSKERNVDGIRCKRFFFNDITASKDQDKIHKHEEDFSSFVKQWEPRKYNDNNVTRFFKGTAYNLYDFLNETKRKYGVENAQPSKKFKYTRVNEDTKSVFIAVPKLDFSTNKKGVCTLPQQYSTEEARKKMQDDPKTFWAMDMQQPLPMEGMPFDYKNLRTYSVIPHEDKEHECCRALLDPARTGANFISMPIFVKIKDTHYLKDALFQMKPMEECIEEVIDLIEKHRITRLDVEKNTENSIKLLLDTKLRERVITFCDVQEFYSYKNKDDKIMDNESSIKKNMCFPEFGLYALGSQMGQFMKWFTGYSYKVKNKYDDAPDSVAMFNERFIMEKTRQYATVSTFRR